MTEINFKCHTCGHQNEDITPSHNIFIDVDNFKDGLGIRVICGNCGQQHEITFKDIEFCAVEPKMFVVEIK